MAFKHYLFLLFAIFCLKGYTQDVEFHLQSHLFPSKNIIKVKRDFRDPYLWILAQNNEVYRVNSITLAVDDFTSQFAPYQGLQFIDIAGRSQDTVFIGTNSTNVLEYKKGTIKVIGAADGITGTVNSVGIDLTSNRNNFAKSDFTAFFATNHGLCRYDFKNEIMIPPPVDHESRIFEATYRTELLYDSEFCRCYPSDSQPVPIFQLLGYTIYSGEVYLGANFGNTLKTVFNTSQSAYGNQYYSLFVNQFWATEKGLFENNWNFSYDPNRPYKKYLEGKDITKITSIFGLLSFSNINTFGVAKEHLLVGTANGLYYSNSQYQTGLGSDYSFYQYSGLGNIAVNDICVNANTYAKPFYSTEICEDGAWVATVNGLYLIKPDWSKFNGSAQINAIQFSDQPYGTTEVQICSGTSTKLNIDPNVYSAHTLQWYKDGQEIKGGNNPTLQTNQSGDYSAKVYDPCDANVYFASNHLKVTVAAAPVFSFNFPDQILFCDSATATFKVEGKPDYQYRWYKDGILNGNLSNQLHITENGKYKVEVSTCPGTWLASKEVKAEIIKLPVIALKSDKIAYCTGDQAALSVNTPSDTAYTINWVRDGIVLDANTNKTTLITPVAGNYSVKISSNKFNCSTMSDILPITFDAQPTISLEKIINTTLCSGETIDLKATITGGTVKWSTGGTGDHIRVWKPGSYTATVTSLSGCTAIKSVDIAFYDHPVLALQDTTLCEFTKEQVTLNAPSGFSKYVWNGIPGDNTYTTGLPGKVELIVTDKKGCTASQTINITSYCAHTVIPNAFTPNGDGINDTWTIAGLDHTSSVKVYDRYGTLVFESFGYIKPWDGRYKGNTLPVGTYYYIIKTRNGKQILSGWLLILF